MAEHKLTDEQLAAINYEGRHAIIEAVPGSGKTTVLLARLRRLLRTGHDARAILAVMFNKSAQLHFEQRLRQLCADAPALPEVRTFHAVGYRILRNLVVIGALSAWELHTGRRLAERFARQALKAAWTAAHGSRASPSAEQFQEFLTFITRVKAQLGSAEAVFKAGKYSYECAPFVPAFAGLLATQARRRVMFFDDLIYRPVLLLAEHPDLWTTYADRYDEILVDETQDINPVQFELVRGLAGKRARVIAVGDPRQSIYAFRGSDVRLLTEEFPRVFAPCKHFPINRTFRFGPRVALLANHLIAHNPEHGDAVILPAAGTPDTAVDEVVLQPRHASGLVDVLTPYWHGGRLREAAVLGRNYSHLVPYEIELAEAGIPYHVYGRRGLLFLPEIAALVCALSLVADRWIVGPDDRYHFMLCLLSVPTMYLPREQLERLADALEPHLTGASRVQLGRIVGAAAAQLRRENARVAANLDARADALQLLTSSALVQVPAASVIQAYIKMTGMREAIERSAATPDQARETNGNLDAFIAFAERAGSIGQFLDRLGPLAAHKEDQPPEEDHCMLTTLHRSKGLEWPLVAIVGLARGAFPVGLKEDTEEERRLAFVGFTRAQRRLVLFHPVDKTFARSNHELGWLPDAVGSASPFLYEAELGLSNALAAAIAGTVPVELVARTDRVASRYLAACNARHVRVAVDPKARASERALAGARPMPAGTKLALGAKVVHPRWGSCTVVDVFHPPVYRVRNAEGTDFTAVLDTANGWQAAAS